MATAMYQTPQQIWNIRRFTNLVIGYCTPNREPTGTDHRR